MKTIKFISILALMLLTSVTANAQNSLVGDVNKDGTVNIADVTMVVDIILNGQKELSLSASEISLDKGISATVVITYGSGSYTVSSADTNIADASLSGSTVIITGKKGGTTVVKVIDTISGNMKDVSVTVNDYTPVSYYSCPDRKHPHLIDLGLPSGTKWACCNVDADNPEAYGGYYAWGETEEKEVYNWATYIHCDGSEGSCHNIGIDISGTKYDVAHVKWGGKWCMPTLDDIEELIDNCTCEWTTINGVYGKMFSCKSHSGSIFLPAAGYYWNSGLNNAGTSGGYRSSTQAPDYSDGAYYLYISGGSEFMDNFYRCIGRSVRPVVRK
ncbi:MAG: hypothetical protein IKH63_10965 [Prevotella sp.]|nr:hypothetical protein [Prevotella sp.]